MYDTDPIVDQGFPLLETKLRPTISSQNLVIDGMYL